MLNPHAHELYAPVSQISLTVVCILQAKTYACIWWKKGAGQFVRKELVWPWPHKLYSIGRHAFVLHLQDMQCPHTWLPQCEMYQPSESASWHLVLTYNVGLRDIHLGSCESSSIHMHLTKELTPQVVQQLSSIRSACESELLYMSCSIKERKSGNKSTWYNWSYRFWSPHVVLIRNSELTLILPFTWDKELLH